MTIVKVQRAIAGHNAGTAIGLVYDRERKHMLEQPLMVDTIKALNGDMKGYFEGAWSSIVGWGLSRRVEDQSW